VNRDLTYYWYVSIENVVTEVGSDRR